MKCNQHRHDVSITKGVEQNTKADLQTVTLFEELQNLKTKKRASQLNGGLVLPSDCLKTSGYCL